LSQIARERLWDAYYSCCSCHVISSQHEDFKYMEGSKMTQDWLESSESLEKEFYEMLLRNITSQKYHELSKLEILIANAKLSHLKCYKFFYQNPHKVSHKSRKYLYAIVKFYWRKAVVPIYETPCTIIFCILFILH